MRSRNAETIQVSRGVFFGMVTLMLASMAGCGESGGDMSVPDADSRSTESQTPSPLECGVDTPMSDSNSSPPHYWLLISRT